LTLSQARREQVKQGRLQGLALTMLHLFCLGEEQLPPSGKRPFAHIVYAVGSIPRA
jgi:hypothetical protein